MNSEKQSTNLQMTLREVNRVGEVKKNIPKLRFKGYEDAWEQRKLGEVSQIVGGGTPSTGIPEYWDGDIDWYSPVEIGEEIFVSCSQRKITQLGLEKSSAKILPVGTVLFTSRAGIGNTAILEKEGCTNQGFQSIVPKDNELDSYFIFSCSHLLKKYGETKGAGSTFVEISGKQMSLMPLNIPEIKEQKSVGNFFRKLDSIITLHQRKYDALKSMKKTMLSKMFPKNGEDVPEIRFKGFTDAWEQRKFGEISKRVQGNDGRMNLPTLTISAAYGWMDQIDRFSGNIAGTEQKNYTLLKKGELSYNHGNSKLAKYGAVFELSTYEEALVPKVYHSFRMIKGDSKFIEFLFATKLPDRELSKLISSGARMDGLLNITYSDFATINLTVPSEAEQNMVSNCLKALDDLLTLHQRKLDELKNMKKTLLQQMFV